MLIHIQYTYYQLISHQIFIEIYGCIWWFLTSLTFKSLNSLDNLLFYDICQKCLMPTSNLSCLLYKITIINSTTNTHKLKIYFVPKKGFERWLERFRTRSESKIYLCDLGCELYKIYMVLHSIIIYRLTIGCPHRRLIYWIRIHVQLYVFNCFNSTITVFREFIQNRKNSLFHSLYLSTSIGLLMYFTSTYLYELYVRLSLQNYLWPSMTLVSSKIKI